MNWISPVLDTIQGYNYSVKECSSYEEAVLWCFIIEAKGIKARATEGGSVVVRKEDANKIKELKLWEF